MTREIPRHDPDSPAVVAHRGASEHRAEHTLGAYAVALEQGADAVECDVRLSRDGHLVCLHDRRVDRVSSGRGVVSTLPLAGLAALDFGRWHSELPESADELVAEPVAVPSAPAGQRGLLTLADLLGLIADHDRPVRLFVETKHPVRYGGLVETKLAAALERYGLARPPDKESAPVAMMSFSSGAVRRMRERAPAVPTVLLFDRFRRGLAAKHDGSLPSWADRAGPSVAVLRADPGYVARAAAKGHSTYAWTADDPADVALCHRLGVRHIATNSPVSTRRVLDSAGSTTVARTSQ